jgi:hypothetical protein
MKTNAGRIDRIAHYPGSMVLLGLTLTSNIGLWGWLGLVPWPQVSLAGAQFSAGTPVQRSAKACW